MKPVMTIQLSTLLDLYDVCKRYNIDTLFYQPYKNDVFSILEFTAGFMQQNWVTQVNCFCQHDDLHALQEALFLDNPMIPKGRYNPCGSPITMCIEGEQAFIEFHTKKTLLIVLKNLGADIKTLKKFAGVSATQRLLSIDNGRPDWLQVFNSKDEDSEEEENEALLHPLHRALTEGTLVYTQEVESNGTGCHTEKTWVRVDCHNPLIMKLTHVIVSFAKSRTGKSLVYRLYIPRYKEMYAEYNETFVQELKDLAKSEEYNLALIKGRAHVTSDHY